MWFGWLLWFWLLVACCVCGFTDLVALRCCELGWLVFYICCLFSVLLGFCLLFVGLRVLLIVLVGYVYFSVGVVVLLVRFIVGCDLVVL